MSGEEPNACRIGILEEAWGERNSSDLGEWAAKVSSAFFEAKISPESAARLLGTQLAEFEATLALASLEDGDLDIVSKANPPVTTWLFLADCSSEDLPLLLKDISTEGDEKSFGQRAQAFLAKLRGPSISDKFAELDSQVFTHLAKKAERFGVLRPKDISALKSFGSRLRGGKPLTPRQVSYAHSLLNQLYDHGVVSSSSRDDDAEVMTKVLELLGKE